MQVGDIVEIGNWKGAIPDERKHGKVLRFEGYHRWSSMKSYSTGRELLAEVLWQNGHTGWILASRLEKSIAE